MLKPKILVADDNPEELKLLNIELMTEGYDVILAKNGEEAFKKACALRPDLILMDILMPDINGGQVIKRLKGKSETRGIPVIFLTAILSKEEEREVGITIDGISYPSIAKPFNAQALIKAVGKYTHRS